MILPPPRSTLFPYTTLFRSVLGVQKLPGQDHEPFETVIGALKDERYGNHDLEDTRLTTDDLKELVRRSEEHTSELQSPYDLVCRLLLEKKKKKKTMCENNEF